MSQNSDRSLNDQTGLPHRMSLGDVLADIQLTPAEIGAFLGQLAANFFGGANHNLGQALRDHAVLVTDPRTYGYKAPESTTPSGETPYTPPTAEQLSYSQLYGTDTPRPPSMPLAPATSAEPPPSPTGALQPTPPMAQRAPDTGEPAWMTQARAAGWQPEASDTDKSPPSATTPESKPTDITSASPQSDTPPVPTLTPNSSFIV